MTYKIRSYHDRDSKHGSPAFRADVPTIAPPRFPTLYANFSIYKPLTSFVLLSDLLFPAIGGTSARNAVDPWFKSRSWYDRFLYVNIHLFILMPVSCNTSNLLKIYIFQRLNPLDGLSDEELIAKYRLSRECILDLLEIITPDIQRTTHRTHAIQPIVQLTTALRFFAIGTFQRECGDIHGLSKSSVSRCIGAVSSAISRRVRTYITFPRREEELRKIKQGFYEMN